MAARVKVFFFLSFIVVLHSQAMRDYLGWDLWQRATNETRKKLVKTNGETTICAIPSYICATPECTC